MKTLLIILFTILAIGCQSEEASASYTAQEIITEYTNNAYRAKRLFAERTVVTMRFTIMEEKSGYVGIVGFYDDGWFACLTDGEPEPDWIHLNMGDRTTVSGYHERYDWADGTIGVVFTGCTTVQPI